MRRLAALAVVAGVLVVPAAASAYPLPPALTSAPSSCAPRPNDYGAGGTSGWTMLNSTQTIAAGASADFTGTVVGGAQTVVVAASSASATYTYWVDLKQSDGSWVDMAYQSVSGNASSITLPPGLPPSAVKVSVRNTSASSQPFTAEVVGDWGTNADQWQEQAQADSCALTVQDDAQRHTDLQQLHTDSQAVKSAVNALTANGTNLDTLNADLATVHSDLQTLNATVAAGQGGGSGTQNVSLSGPVRLSPADRQLSADVANQLNGDLWVLVGVVIGCFAAGFILNRVWPR